MKEKTIKFNMSFTMTIEVSDETNEKEIREKSTKFFESVFNASEWENEKIKEIKLEKVSIINGNEEPDIEDGWIKAVYHVEKPGDIYIYSDIPNGMLNGLMRIWWTSLLS